jgi:hypothetical protein
MALGTAGVLVGGGTVAAGLAAWVVVLVMLIKKTP